MLKLSIRPQWQLIKQGNVHALPRLLELLQAIDIEGGIAAAAVKLGVSYRHAWGIIQHASREFGAPLLEMSRGRRATLSLLGEKLIAANQRINARIAPLLDSLASELESEIERARPGSESVVRVHASHGYSLELLREFLLRKDVPLEIKYRGSMEALASLAGGNCDVASFHVPLGPLQASALKFYVKWLDPDRHMLVNLSTRRQGIMLAEGNPKRIQSLADLLQPGVQFVNRQFGSGTRILLDLLLKSERLDSRAIAGYDTGEFTHSGVAACVASGLADAGFGVETGARLFNLDFIPVASERYFLICNIDALGTPTLQRIREILASKQYQAEAGKLIGVDVTHAGHTLTIAQAFPELPSRKASPGRRAAAALD
ncbi:MAG: substrate-binding domain-containing protein [Casimicrobiaceae bacterium]